MSSTDLSLRFILEILDNRSLPEIVRIGKARIAAIEALTATARTVTKDSVSIAAAEKMGATGAKPTEEERQLFEAWMKGHCWAVCGKFDGKTYSGSDVYDDLHPYVMHTRGLWAAWRDRAALAAPSANREVIEALIAMVSAQHAGPITDEMLEAWKKGRAVISKINRGAA
jgi:hypothetical protein